MNRFPVQCRLLVQRSKDYGRDRRLLIETVLRTALIEEPPPTIKDVASEQVFGAVKYESGFRICMVPWLTGALSGASGGWQNDPSSKR